MGDEKLALNQEASAATPPTGVREWREHNQRLAADLEAMRRLQEVSTRLVRDGDPSLLWELVDTAIAITGADMGNITLRDASTGALKIAASRGLDAAFLAYVDNVQQAGPPWSSAMYEASRLVTEDVETSPIFAGSEALDVMRAAGVRAVQSTPLLDRSGRLVGTLSTHYRSPRVPSDRDLRLLDLLARQAADWVARTHAEEALRSSEEKFRSYFELGLIGMAITSPSKECLAINDKMCAILGYSRRELLGKTWSEMTHPDDLAADVVQFNRVMAGDTDGYSLDKRWIRKDGKVIDSTISVKCLRRSDGSVHHFMALVQDITRRKRTEHALRESEERYRTLTSQVKEFAIFSTDDGGIVTTWNEGCQHVLGYTQEEFVGLSVAQLCTPDDQVECLPAAELQRAADSGTASIERWMLAHRERRFFAMGAATALRDNRGRLTGFCIVLRDVTAMKLSQDRLAQQEEQLERLVSERTDQLQKTTERLRLSERMASLGTLAAGLGHDIGNLLLPLDVRLKVMLDAELDPDVRELAVGIQTCTRFFQQLSNGLRLMAADPLAARSRTATELKRWWNDVGPVLKCVLPHGVHMEHQLPNGECWIAMGRAALSQAVFNLVQNAADAVRERGYGRVTICAEEVRGTTMVAVRVADDGPGMTDDVLRHCMEPSFSTKARSASSGLGLAFVQGLVSRAEGLVEIESTLGRGTRVSLILPGTVLGDQIDDTPVFAVSDS